MPTTALPPKANATTRPRPHLLASPESNGENAEDTSNDKEKGRTNNEKRAAKPPEKTAKSKHHSDKSSDSNADAGGATSGLSFAERAARLDRTPTPLLVKGDRLLRDIDRAPPGDPPLLHPRRKSLLLSSSGSVKVPRGDNDDSGGRDLARRRSQYFEDAFSARGTSTSPAKERVRGEALVLVEVRTNVIIGDEFTVITELSAHLAVRYRRPLSSIVVTLQHNSCMCFGGSFDPAYVLAVFALPAELQPATNKRNAAVLQKHMEEALGVPPARGLVRFVAVPEANLAYGGKTTMGHVDDLAKNSGTTGGGDAAFDANQDSRSPVDAGKGTSVAGASDEQKLTRNIGSRKQKTSRKLSVKSLSSFRSPSPPPSTPAPSVVEEQPPLQQPLLLPAIPERSPKESPWGKAARREENGKEQAKLESNPGGASGTSGVTGETAGTARQPASTSRQPSWRARRPKSFVATLFGLAGAKQEAKATLV